MISPADQNYPNLACACANACAGDRQARRAVVVTGRTADLKDYYFRQ